MISPMAFQQSVYQQIAYQQQMNQQRQMMFAAKQQASRVARAQAQAANDEPSSNISLGRSHETLSLATSGSDAASDEVPAERLFVLATRADNAGRDATAARLYKRVIAMAPRSSFANHASDKLGNLTR
jgi:predicted Zn-dependent protease